MISRVLEGLTFFKFGKHALLFYFTFIIIPFSKFVFRDGSLGFISNCFSAYALRILRSPTGDINETKIRSRNKQ
jgi:hypothetical protein